MLEANLIEAYIDGKAIPTKDRALDIEPHLLTLTLPYRPKHNLTTIIYADEETAEELVRVSIKTIDAPTVAAQSVQVYEGEDIHLTGANFVDQLDLSCTIDNYTAEATVLTPDIVSCPASLLRLTKHGPHHQGLRPVQVRSSSL